MLLCWCQVLQGEKGARKLCFHKCDSGLPRIRIPKLVWGLCVLATAVSFEIFINAFRDWAKLRSAFSLKPALTKPNQITKFLSGNWKSTVKNINPPSLQMLCPLVKKINPLHNEQNNINSFLNGQDASKVLVDLSGKCFSDSREKSDH